MSREAEARMDNAAAGDPRREDEFIALPAAEERR